MGRSFVILPYEVDDMDESTGPMNYGCVRRCRHRRLVTYLWLNGFRDTLRGLLNETDAFMSVPHLARLVVQGLWEDAMGYVSRFLRPTSHPQSDEAQVLLHFLSHHKAFSSMVAGGSNLDVKYFNRKYKQYLKHDATVPCDALRIRSIIMSLLYSEQVRASLDWERVREKASEIVQDLAYKAPELKDLVLLPGGSMMPQDVLPLGFRFRSRRRYMKEQDQPTPRTLTKIFLAAKKRLPSSTRSHELNSGLTEKTRKWLADILDESLQAGSRLELQSSEKEGAPVAPVSQTASGALTVPAKIYGISSVTNTRAPVAKVSQTLYMTIHSENSGISAVTNAGTSKLLSSEKSNLRKHPRTDQTTVEQDPHPKVQRISGAFGEACLASVIEAGGRSRAGIVLEGPKHELDHA